MWAVQLQGLLSILSSALDVAAHHQKILYYHSFLFTLPAHEVVEPVIPLVVLFLRQANRFAAAGADLFVTLLHLICIVHISHNWKQYNTATEKRKPKISLFLNYFPMFNQVLKDRRARLRRASRFSLR